MELSGRQRRVLLGPDQTVYYSLGTTIVSLVHPTNIGGNGLIIIAIVVFDLIVLSLYGRMLWMNRKSKKGHEPFAPAPEKKSNKKN